MLLEPPTKVSQETITLDVREIEPLLQAPPMGMLPVARRDDHAQGRPDDVHPRGHASRRPPR